MVTLNELKNKIQTYLNQASNNSGLDFILFADTGEYEKATFGINAIDRHINGLCSVIGSEITSNNAELPIAAITVRTDIIAFCENFENDENIEFSNGDEEIIKGNKSLMERVRDILDGVCSKQKSFTETKDGKTYSCSVEFEITNTGIRQSRMNVGDSMTFSFNAYFYIVESGESSLAYEYYLDGYLIPYMAAVPVRNSMIENDVYSSSKIGKATSTGNTFAIKFTLPSFALAFNAPIKNYLWNGDDNVHVLVKNNRADFSRNHYLCLIQSVEGGQTGVSNAAESITLTVAYDNYEFISFPENFYVKQMWEVIRDGNALNFVSTHKIYYKFQTDGKIPSLIIFDKNGNLKSFTDDAYTVEIDNEYYFVFVIDNSTSIPFSIEESITVNGTTYYGGGMYIVSNVDLYFDLEE